MSDKDKQTTPAIVPAKATIVGTYVREMNTQLANPAVRTALLNITFKGLKEEVMKQAILEGLMVGFTFKNFLIKDVYAIPFGGNGKPYSLVTSISHARKVAMRSGLCGKTAPIYTYTDDNKVETCTVTVKRMTGGYVGDYTATVDFSEYTTGKNLWVSKPKTMIAKVAEMHALRAGFPEEMSAMYAEEEMEKEAMGGFSSRLNNAMVDKDKLKIGNFQNNDENQDTSEDIENQDTQAGAESVPTIQIDDTDDSTPTR